ncbi:MAG: ABC transporter permease subunit [Pseudomonadota bacterium]|nr:ABC transporter permease subunit [Pseudomonadota bacterium]
MMRRILLVAVGLLLAFFVGLPLALLAADASSAGLTASEGEAILNTVLLAAGTAGVACLAGLPVGWVAARRRLPSALEAAIILPYAVPPYVTTIAWILLANPTNGILTAWLPVNAYTLAGMIGVLGLHLSPVVAMATRDALGRIDPVLEEAARVAGASAWRTTLSISLPLTLPAVGAAVAFVASAAAASFGVPYLLGAGASPPVPVLTLRIYRALELAPVEGRPLAVGLSLVLLAVGVAIPAALRLFQGQRAYASARLARPRPVPPAGALALVVYTWLAIAVALPVGTIALTSVAPVFGHFDAFTLDHWHAVLSEPRTRGALVRSFVLAAGAATAAVAIGSLLAHTAERTPSRAVSALVALARAPWAIPGTVLALGMILAFSQEIRLIVLDRATLVVALADTSWLLGIAYAAKSLALPLDGVRAAVRTVDRSLEEAARISGAGWSATQRRVVLPLLTPALLAGWSLVFASSFCEVSMSILLRGPSTEVLGTRLFELLSYGTPQQAAVIAMVVVAAVLVLGRALAWRVRWA